MPNNITGTCSQRISQLSNVKFDDNILISSEFTLVNFTNSSFVRVAFARVKLMHVAFGRADFERASFEDVTIDDWLNSADIDSAPDADGRFEDDLPNFSNATFTRVTVDGHPVTEADFKWAHLCNTMIEGLKSDRDCKQSKK